MGEFGRESKVITLSIVVNCALTTFEFCIGLISNDYSWLPLQKYEEKQRTLICMKMIEYTSLSLIAHLLAPSLSLFSVYKIYHSVLADYISCTLTLGAQITKIWDAIALFLVYYCQLKWNSIRPVCRISLFLASSNLVIIQYLQCI